jgi:CMP-N-acetylneuraminic acid synthetase
MKVFLPIKNHSERVPGKNFLLLNGKPLYMWIVDSLLQCDEISQIVIDTDSDNEGLLSLDANKKVSIKKRNQSLIGDDVSMNFLIQDFLSDHGDETFIMTHATNPFLSPKTIKSAIKKFKEATQDGFDSLVAVNKYQSRFYFEDFTPVNHDPSILLKTQDLSCVFEENSCLYIFTKGSFDMNNKNRIGKNPYLFATPKFESLDIDTNEDWNFAELFANQMTFANDRMGLE